ncbi:MAG: DNA recombination protein RmuC [Pseudomonadota bacterium]
MEPVLYIADRPFDAVHAGLLCATLVAIGFGVWAIINRNTQRMVWKLERTSLDNAVLDTQSAMAVMESRLSAAEQRAIVAEQSLAVIESRTAENQQQFSAMAQAAVRSAHESFTERANETFARHQQSAQATLQSLIAPINETFEAFKERVETLETVRTEDKTAIFEQVRAINDQLVENRAVTGKLVTALSAPQGGGRWGEESLRNVLEMAGLSTHADFMEQTNDQVDGKVQRPDVIIRMPGGREIVIDAKVSVHDFLLAAETHDVAEQNTLLAGHARKMRDHVKRLAAKEYWKDFSDRVDFVAMYVPGENFYAAALQHDRDLFDFAARNRVLIVTPSTLIALAKAVAYGWRQEEAAGNAREAALLGQDLYEALCAMGAHLDRVGKSLGHAVGSYNAMVGSIERNVLPKARRFETLQIAQPGAKALADPLPIEDPVRRPTPDGELSTVPSRSADEAA